ncbi:MAG: hypothetical protein R2776_03215 [Flavobacteriaceae bacterium]|nr:hypothetical protein [Flavobacteriaceae bacterium]
MSKTFEDGFYLKNNCIGKNGPLTIRTVAYDANKVMLPQDAPEIPFSRTRFISTKHIGNTDFVYILLFFDTENFSAPPGIDIISGTQGGGGGLGVTILGFGISVGASATVTKAFSQPVSAIQMELNKFPIEGGQTKLWSSWEISSKHTDDSEAKNHYVFTATDLKIPSSNGELLGS